MKKRLMGIITSIVLVLCAIPYNAFNASAISCRKNYFDKSKYTLSGNMAKDVATIAKSQNGRTQAQFGYTEAWCDEFVADCIENAGAGSDIVAHGGTVGDFLKIMKNKGAVQVDTPKAGDLVFYYRASTKSYPHVAIMLDSTNSAQGNIWLNGYSQAYCMSYKSYGDGNGNKIGSGLTAVFMRPAYKDSVIPPTSYTSIKAGDYYLKNKSTGTYLTVDGAKAANKQNISVAKKQTSNAFKFKASGGTSNYLSSMINTSFVVNPLSDNPGNGTNVTLYTKDNSGTQTWKFEAVSGGYIIHNGHNESCVLDVSNSNVLIKTKTGADSQIWMLESADKQLSGISITSAAAKTQYWRNETLETGGLVLKANYSDGSSKSITSGFKTEYDFSQTGEREVKISYTENGITKSTSYKVNVTHPFTGEGTAQNPYIIANRNDLFRLADVINNNKYINYDSLCYKQTADINLNNNDWIPIGIYYETSTSSNLDNNRTFKGNYDGDYHSITGLKVDYNRNYAGLFGRTNAPALIENLSVSGSVNNTGACTGGIIGELAYGSQVKNCDFSGTVSGVQCVGGIAGKIHRGGTISTCYVNGVITATGDSSAAGGITSTIQIGDHASSADALIENCYFAGKVNAPINGALSSDIIVGTVNKSTASFYGNYYLENSANGAVGENEQSGCQKFSSEKLKKAAEYLGYPYVSAGSGQNDGYPVFEWQKKETLGDVNADGEFTVSDAVILQKWLLAEPGIKLVDWKAADLCEDDKLDIFDMIEMRKLLIQNNSLSAQ